VQGHIDILLPLEQAPGGRQAVGRGLLKQNCRIREVLADLLADRGVRGRRGGHDHDVGIVPTRIHEFGVNRNIIAPESQRP
jgi:hypothetical protein